MANDFWTAKGNGLTTSHLFDLYVWGPTQTDVGAIPESIAGLAIDPTDGTLYGVTSHSSASNPDKLVSIDKTTGVATVIGATGHPWDDIDFDSSGQLYGVTAFTGIGSTSKLYTINKASGAAVLVGDTTLSNDSCLAIRKSTDVGYAYQNSDGHLYAINLATAGITDLGATSPALPSGPSALAFDSLELLWFVNGSTRIFTIDIATLDAVEPVTLSGIHNYDAAAWEGHQAQPAFPGQCDWAYDQAGGTVTVTVHNSVAGRAYEAFCDDPGSSTAFGTGNGGDLIMVVSGVSGLTAGDVFEGEVDDDLIGYPVDINGFQFGTSSTGYSDGTDWTFDGALDVSASFTPPIPGNDYTLALQYYSAGSSVSESTTATSVPTSVTIPFTLSQTPDAGIPISAVIFDNTVGTFFAARFFAASVADTGRPGTIGGSPTPPSGGRFPNLLPWRTVVTDLQYKTTTWMENLQLDRNITKTGNQATVITAGVHPDDFRVNGLFDDGYPRLAQSNRLVFMFRREGVSALSDVPWVCRAAGILMSPDDDGDPDVVLTHFTAYDPWKLLEGRPALQNDGSLPGQDGIIATGPGSDTALQMLLNTMTYDGGVFIDAGVAWGGTSGWAGTIEATDDIVLNISAGQSVADVWNALCDAGNMDIVLTPIYDPDRFVTIGGTDYYFTHDLSIYATGGADKPAALHAWDKLNHSVTKIERMHDGTPGAFFNKVLYFAGAGGPPADLSMPYVNAPSVAAFGSYWAQQFFPALTSDVTGAAAAALAAQSLVLAKQGRRTLTMDTITGRAPTPLVDYDILDRIPIHASKRLRVTADGLFRVEGFTIAISDDGVERTTGLLVTPDYRGAP